MNYLYLNIVLLYNKLYKGVVMDFTSIQVHKDTRDRLKLFMDYKRETYDELLNKMMNLMQRLNEEPELAEAYLEDIKVARGSTGGLSTSQMLTELGISQ
jgi:hypothetical protein